MKTLRKMAVIIAFTPGLMAFNDNDNWWVNIIGVAYIGLLLSIKAVRHYIRSTYE